MPSIYIPATVFSLREPSEKGAKGYMLVYTSVEEAQAAHPGCDILELPSVEQESSDEPLD